MSLKHCFLTAAVLALSTGLWAAPDLVIPASASAEGIGGSRWQSEVTLHNAGTRETSVALALHGDAGLAAGPVSIKVPARSTVVLSDIVKTQFGAVVPVGAITIDLEDLALRKLAVSSRTFNLSPTGEFGQDIPAVPIAEAMSENDTVILTAPSNAATARFNFGLYALEETTVEWKLLRKDGTEAATVTRTYGAGRHTQHGNGVTTLLNAVPQDADVLHAKIQKGVAIFYGSAINNATGDPTFVPASRTRENLGVEILGLDMDENGTLDIQDADGDGVLDQTLTLPVGRFPIFFRIVAVDPEGAALTYTFVNAPRDVLFVDNAGTVQWYPSSELHGTTGSLIVSVSDGIDSADLIIPVRFE
jgi:hypothetical protein